ncbi:MAG: hypothetical protein IPL33_12130 [Sphingobacteriales bacterium]|nr:hypothetical protein [Sphingobacteriales bacterium]MCC7222235.1 hypothetical protein [Chitinophagales bacterium]
MVLFIFSTNIVSLRDRQNKRNLGKRLLFVCLTCSNVGFGDILTLNKVKPLSLWLKIASGTGFELR